MADDEKAPTIIIKKVKKVAGGHHGGAWKVAYADFVTAMMAFFLLLWLLNVTTDEEKVLISSYFSPSDPRVATSMSGSGGVLGGTAISKEGAMSSTTSPIVSQPESIKTNDSLEKASNEAIKKEMEQRDNKRFQTAEDSLRQAIASQPELKALAQNLLIDQTPEGLRIQIVDQEGKPMFPLGSTEPLKEARILLNLVTKIIIDIPNKISIRGHTDSSPYGAGAKYTNWELSSDRANASRRVMLKSGLDIERIENVMGKADREHLIKNKPNSPRNRRISIILLRESLVPVIQKEKTIDTIKQYQKTISPRPIYDDKPITKPKKHEDGIIYFP